MSITTGTPPARPVSTTAPARYVSTTVVATPVSKPPATSLDSLSRIAVPNENELIGVISEPGAGKTTWACLFPNPYILDFDKKAKPGVKSAPFWDDDWVRGYMKQSAFQPPNRRDALTKFLVDFKQELAKHTIILDGWTAYQAGFDVYTEYEKPRDSGKDAMFSFYRKKIEISELVCTLLKSIATTSIVAVHELPDRNEDGNLTGKIKPFMDGKFADAMAGKFTDFVRLVVNPFDIDLATGKPKKDLTTNQPIQLKGRYIQLNPDKVFTPILGHNKTPYILANNLAYVSADHYADWIKLSNSTK